MLGAALAGVALVFAVASATASSTYQPSRVTWPSPDVRLPDAVTAGHTPLLPATQRAERLTLAVGCRALLDAAAGTTVLATTRPEPGTKGLHLRATGAGALALDVAGRSLATVRMNPAVATERGCRLDLDVTGTGWHVRVAGSTAARGEFADDLRPPIVAALASDLVGGGSDLVVHVVSMTGGSTPSAAQRLLLGAAGVAAIAALACLRRRRPSSGTARRRVRLVRLLHPVDALVVVAVVAWAVVGPTLFDDGWVMSTVRNSRTSGDFSNYFEDFGAILPFGWLHDWTLRAADAVSPSLLALRLPAVLLGLGTWALCRVALARAARTRVPAFALFATAGGFLVFHCSWLSTLRPEPFVAVLTVVVLLLATSFDRTGTWSLLALAASAAALATTVHPDGLVAWAPILVLLPRIVPRLRAADRDEWLRLGGYAALVAAVTVALLFADSSVSLWRGQRRALIDSGSHALSWRSELYRYDLLLTGMYGTVARRASVFFAGVAVFFYLTRRERAWRTEADLPAAALLASTLLLLVTPSKWPWHFGALAGFAAVALGAEVLRLRQERTGEGIRWSRGPMALAVVLLATSVAWRGGDEWQRLDLPARRLGPAEDRLLPMDLSSPTLLLLLLGASLAAFLVVRRGAARRWLASASVWAPGLSLLAIVGSTIAVFAVDTAEAWPSWTVGKQNLDSLTRSSCGLAEQLVLADPVPGTALAVAAVDDGPAPFREPPLRFRPDAVGANAPGTASHIEGPTWGSRVNGDGDTGAFASPWFTLPAGNRPLGLWVSGGLDRPENTLRAQFGTLVGGRMRAHGLQPVPVSHSDDAWALFGLDAAAPEGATHLRIVAVDGSDGFRGWLGFSAPQEVRLTSLANRLEATKSTALVVPDFRPYFPCVEGPTLNRGVAGVPDVIVSDGGFPSAEASPFRHLGDVYRIRRLHVAVDGPVLEGPLVVYHVDRGSAGPFVPARVR